MEAKKQNRYAGTGKNKAQQKASYKAYKKAYNASPKEKRKRAARNAARKEAIKSGKVKRGDKYKQVDHKVGLSKGGTNEKSNLQIISAKKNAQKREREWK